jgi:lipid-binding SYLF domain-containing protein
MKEAFRNSGVVGSSIVCSSKRRGNSSTQFKSAPSEEPTEKSNFEKSRRNGSSSNYLADLFSDDEERDLLGIAFFTIWEAGVMVSGYGGTGIVLSRNIVTGDWSGPVAVQVSGIGAGLLLGASIKTIVYLMYDYFTLKSIIGTESGGVIFGIGAGATVGTWTKDTGKQTAYITSPKMLRTAGMGSNIALCRGLAGMYGAVSVEAGICKSRDKINARFYGQENLTGSDILLSGRTIEIPDSTVVGDTAASNVQAKRLLEKIHSKLERLCYRDGNADYNYNQNDNNHDHNEDEDEEETSERREMYADESENNFDIHQNSDEFGEKKDDILETSPLASSPLAASPLSSNND